MPLNYAHGYYKAPNPLINVIPEAGEFINYGTDTPPSVTDTITIVNNNTTTTEVNLTINLASELTIQSTTTSEGTFDGTTWYIATLNANDTATLNIYSTAVIPVTEVSSITYNLTTGTNLEITTDREENLTPTPGDTQTLWLTAENACGYTEISDGVQIIFSTTDGLEIALPETIRTQATGFLFFHLCIGNTAETATRIYRWEAYDRVTGAELPLNPIILFRDAHLEPAPSVALPSDLPTGVDRLPGQTRLVIGGVPNSAYYLYDPNEIEEVDGENIIADSSFGKWKITLGSATLGMISPTSENGCAQIPTEVDSQTVRRNLIALNDSTPVEQTIWTKLHYVAETTLEAGTGLQIAPFLDNNFHPGLFKEGIKLRFLGYVDLNNGALITDNPDAPSGEMTTVGQEYFYDPFFPTYELETDLNVGFAAVFEISLFISKQQLGNEAGIGSLFSVDIRPISKAGIPALWGYFTGDLVFNAKDKLRVLPDATIGAGHAIVGRETHPIINEKRSISPLPSNTQDVKIVINGRGDLFIRDPGEPLPETEALRALVSLEEGYDKVVWTPEITVSDGEQLVLTRIIPDYDDVTDTGIIRPEYPVIGGMTCEFNVNFYKLFINKDEIYYEITAPLTLNPLVTDTITVTTLNDTTIITPPTDPPSNFGFFKPPEISVTALPGGGLLSGTYKIGFAYYYSGSQITSINHSVTAGCIPEMGQSLAKISEHNSAWGKTYASTAQLQLAPTANIPQFHQAKVIINNEPIDVIFNPLEAIPDYPSLDRQIGGWTQKDYGGLLWALIMSE